MKLRFPRVRNSADIPQTLSALVGPFVLVAPLALGPKGVPLLGAWLVVWLAICRHNYILHNHVHHPFTDSKWLNRWLDWSLGFTTAMTAGNWRIMHVHGHHVEHLAGRLPSRAHATRLRVDDIQQHWAWQAEAHSLASIPYQFAYPIWRCLRGATKGFRAPYYRYHLREAAIVYGAVAAVIWVFGWIAADFLLPIYGLVYFFSRHVDYITHIGAASRADFAYANVCLSPGFNDWYWNFGYHVAHHHEPKAHWSRLPQIHRSLALTAGEQANIETLNVYGIFRPPWLGWVPIAPSDTRQKPRASPPEPLREGVRLSARPQVYAAARQSLLRRL